MAAPATVGFGNLADFALPPAPGVAAAKLGQTLGLTPTVAHWLEGRGLTDLASAHRFLEPRLAHLTPPEGMADREVAAKRVATAIRRRDAVCVFGDYDCDGITATAIMTEVLRELGATVTPLLASRFSGGYGVSTDGVARILATGATLVITCDCGSSDHESIARLAAAGIDVVVIDHHLVPEEPLPAFAFLNPHREDCAFAFKGLASCGLALSLGAALRSELGVALDMRRWLDLVAVGTIADVAPLHSDNRALVRAGLTSLSMGDRPGIRALLELAKHDPGVPLSAEDVAFRLAPRLNAPGRLGSPDLALELLLAEDAATAGALAARLEEQQTARRALQERIIEEACEEIDREGFADRAAIVVGRDGWNHGIVGIAAGRIAERHGKPVIVIGFDRGHGRGSVRGPRNAKLFEAVKATSSVLLRFGGHQAAAGLEVRAENLVALRALFEQACANMPSIDDQSRFATNLLRMHPDDNPSRVLDDLCRLEPCGEGNPAPRLALDAKIVGARCVRGGHLKLELSVSGHRVGGFGINMGSLAEGLGDHATVIGTLRRDRWRGGQAIEIRTDTILR